MLIVPFFMPFFFFLYFYRSACSMRFHRRIVDPDRANPRFVACVASLRMVRVAGRSPQAPYRTPAPPAACASTMPAARRPGFHAYSLTSRAVKFEVRPGRSRGQFKIAAMFNIVTEAYLAI